MDLELSLSSTPRPVPSTTSSSSNDRVTRPPFPWATNDEATVHSLLYLRSKNITKISGKVQCMRCNTNYMHEFDLEEKFSGIVEYIYENKERMGGRATKQWRVPNCLTCNHCGEPNCVRPVPPDNNRNEKINWLFLLLGQFLGYCTLQQLHYFCKHSGYHRIGARDRVLYITYLALCKQLDPKGAFDIIY
ncbi:hydroxyproline-rich glycoprotein family protein [Thalictrum thalictroides]|uniref:Hydroxyproline-rich glycoprotein family protein n=1 Tax=Thalictrum thalictroides TaxID=46969 RepID=A0A7J6VN87_THATH|nr:hydroxyproline-rich glycoprotein family protein [Thalictrum thalictroides]